MTQTITVNYAGSQSSGYGHKKINVSLEIDGNLQTFSATTSNMGGFDAANDLDGQDRYDALYELIRYQIADQVEEWANTL
jgi:hypothetical protein